MNSLVVVFVFLASEKQPVCWMPWGGEGTKFLALPASLWPLKINFLSVPGSCMHPPHPFSYLCCMVDIRSFHRGGGPVVLSLLLLWCWHLRKDCQNKDGLLSNGGRACSDPTLCVTSPSVPHFSVPQFPGHYLRSTHNWALIFATLL